MLQLNSFAGARIMKPGGYPILVEVERHRDHRHATSQRFENSVVAAMADGDRRALKNRKLRCILYHQRRSREMVVLAGITLPPRVITNCMGSGAHASARV